MRKFSKVLNVLGLPVGVAVGGAILAMATPVAAQMETCPDERCHGASWECGITQLGWMCAGDQGRPCRDQLCSEEWWP